LSQAGFYVSSMFSKTRNVLRAGKIPWLFLKMEPDFTSGLNQAVGCRK